jgi:hypothetical protein
MIADERRYFAAASAAELSAGGNDAARACRGGNGSVPVWPVM